jgi:hypothetical protein
MKLNYTQKIGELSVEFSIEDVEIEGNKLNFQVLPTIKATFETLAGIDKEKEDEA